MATVDLEKWKRQAEEDVEANYSSMTYGWFRCPPEVALALICRVEEAKEILEDFIVNDGGHYMTAARLIRRGKAVRWIEALKEETDSVG